MTLESQGRWKILVQLVRDKRRTRIPIIFWEKSMSNKTKLYGNLKNEAVCIAHWQDLRHTLVRKRGKNKLGTSYKKKSKSTMVGQVETTHSADKKANLCAAQLLLLIFYKLNRAFCRADKSCWPVEPSWQRHSLTLGSSLLPFFSWVPGHRASSCLCQDWGGLCKDRKVSRTLCLNQGCCHLSEKAVVSFILHLCILPMRKINIPFIRGIQISSTDQEITPRITWSGKLLF